MMENLDFYSVLSTVITAIVGIVVTAIGILGSFYMKRFQSKLDTKELNDEINRYVRWAETSKTFKLLPSEEQSATLLDEMKNFAATRGIMVSDVKLVMLIENARKSLVSLERLSTLKLKGVKK